MVTGVEIEPRDLEILERPSRMAPEDEKARLELEIRPTLPDWEAPEADRQEWLQNHGFDDFEPEDDYDRI